MKIGLLGGSFNPPHFGHINISHDAINELSLDKIWWLPTKQNPLKERKNSSFESRLENCLRITQDHADIIVRDDENNIDSSFFIDLLKEITKQNPNDEFFVLIGADNLLNFHLWHNYQKIPEIAKLVVFNRNDDLQKAKSGIAFKNLKQDNILFINNKNYDISSTQIRKSKSI